MDPRPSPGYGCKWVRPDDYTDPVFSVETENGIGYSFCDETWNPVTIIYENEQDARIGLMVYGNTL